MNRRILCTIALFLIFLLCGCQLAIPGAEEDHIEPDRLIGAYITTEYIDFYDEEMGEENLAEMISNGEIAINGNTDSLRVYAVKDGSGFAFPGIDGMNLFSYYKKPVDGNLDTGYWTSDISGAISDVHNNYHSSDDEESVKQSATIYVAQNAGDVTFYMNPVYQTEEGEIYLIPGTGIQMGTSLSGSMNQSIREKTTMHVNGKEIAYSCEYELTVSTIDVPTQIILIQMSKNHKVLGRNAYVSGQLPEEFKPDEETAYILIEEITENKVRRSVNQPGTEIISSYCRVDNNLCVLDSMKVLWKTD